MVKSILQMSIEYLFLARTLEVRGIHTARQESVNSNEISGLGRKYKTRPPPLINKLHHKAAACSLVIII